MHCSCQSFHLRQFYQVVQLKRHKHQARPRIFLSGAPKTSDRVPHSSEKKERIKIDKMQRFLRKKISDRTWTYVVNFKQQKI